MKLAVAESQEGDTSTENMNSRATINSVKHQASTYQRKENTERLEEMSDFQMKLLRQQLQRVVRETLFY